MPGIHAAYVKPPIKANPSDQVVTDIQGDTFLEVTFGTWTYDKQGGEGPVSVKGGGNDSFVEELRLTQNYGGVTTWAAGLVGKHEMQVLHVAGTEECPALCYIVNLEANGYTAPQNVSK